ncbi:MAG TPA: prepilin-type N-terminal cleavage/methylation domain-containing protein, partial [Ilumatobacteraceae bacterium]|nr:prepilin-type N-terminal cleavage/methylation domain-containing protein [Ilumatobacteraceae bacterium]
MKHVGGGCAPASRRQRDRGSTFVEVLVALVLLGTAVGGTLTALRTTIISSRLDENQTKAHAWLLAVEDALYRAPYHSCSDPGPG